MFQLSIYNNSHNTKNRVTSQYMFQLSSNSNNTNNRIISRYYISTRDDQARREIDPIIAITSGHHAMRVTICCVSFSLIACYIQFYKL